MRWLTNNYDFRFKWTATVVICIHPTKAWLSLLGNFKNAIWTFEERYAIKFCAKLGKNATKTYGKLQTTFRPSCINRASVFDLHKRFKEGGSLWGMMRGVGGVCWGLKGVQEEIPSEGASTFQIGSVAFPPGQCTSPQLHRCLRLFDRDGHQDSSSPSLSLRPCSLWLLAIP